MAKLEIEWETLVAVVKALLAAVGHPAGEGLPTPSQPPVLAPTPSQELTGTLESWFEEFWHDWLKTDEHPDGYTPMDSPGWTAIVSGKEGLPPGAVVRFMSGLAVPGGKAKVPAGFPIEHCFRVFVPESGTAVVRSISSDDVARDEYQPWPEFGHVQHSQRDWGGPEGCAVTIRLNPDLGKGILHYWAVSASANPSPLVSISVGGK